MLCIFNNIASTGVSVKSRSVTIAVVNITTAILVSSTDVIILIVVNITTYSG